MSKNPMEWKASQKTPNEKKNPLESMSDREKLMDEKWKKQSEIQDAIRKFDNKLNGEVPKSEEVLILVKDLERTAAELKTLEDKLGW